MNTSENVALREKFTIGVEEEYQLVSPEGGDLRSRGAVVRRGDLSGQVDAEVKDAMLEIGTPVCLTAEEVAARLRDRRFQASAAAAAEDLEIVASGMHPFSSWRAHFLTEGSRPRMLAEVFRQLLFRQNIWGMHVHVAVPEEYDRAVLMNTVRTFGPQLLALSCSSPFESGVDTGYASYRTVVWRGFPFVGVPPRFESWEEYRGFIDLLLRAGTIPDDRTLYWSVRPSSRYPTLELRMCDVCPSIGDAVAIAALGRAIVVAAAEGSLEPIGESLSPSLQDEMLRENEWLAARDGLDATLITPEAPGGKTHIRDAIGALVETVAPVLERLGDGHTLTRLDEILTHGNAAERMRRHMAESRTLTALVDWLIEETRAGTGIDRRLRRREDTDPHALQLS